VDNNAKLDLLIVSRDLKKSSPGKLFVVDLEVR
jgi:hypothetical protein